MPGRQESRSLVNVAKIRKYHPICYETSRRIENWLIRINNKIQSRKIGNRPTIEYENAYGSNYFRTDTYLYNIELLESYYDRQQTKNTVGSAKKRADAVKVKKIKTKTK